jgi:hypothetical protein
MVSGAINRVLRIKPVDVTTSKILVLSLWSIRRASYGLHFFRETFMVLLFPVKVGDIMIEE